jgi:putative flippase GtrA
MEELLLKLIKFSVVGFSGLLLDFGLTWWLKEKMAVNRYIANTLGFIFAASSNYFFNKLWTFEDTTDNYSSQYLSFVGIAVIGLLLSNGIIYFLHQYKKQPFYFSKLLAVGIVVLWNFSLNYLFTFK